jgi:hypothetical protein
MGTAVHPLIGNAVFDADATHALAVAFDDICKQMKLPDTADRARENVAMRVLDLAREGVLDPKLLHERIMAEVHAMRKAI